MSVPDGDACENYRGRDTLGLTNMLFTVLCSGLGEKYYPDRSVF
jgi:hypothetical protein